MRPWRFSLVLDAQCQIERVRIVPSKSSFVFDLDGSLLHKGFFFLCDAIAFLLLPGWYGSRYLFQLLRVHTQFCQAYDYRLRAILRLPSITPTYPF